MSSTSPDGEFVVTGTITMPAIGCHPDEYDPVTGKEYSGFFVGSPIFIHPGEFPSSPRGAGLIADEPTESTDDDCTATFEVEIFEFDADERYQFRASGFPDAEETWIEGSELEDGKLDLDFSS